jgi:23S rRNA maturation-related 3'-5' exoribonuclease YhaM
MNEILITIAAPVVVSILTGLVGWGFVLLRTYIKTKTDSVIINDALERVTNTAETVVRDLEQTVVPYYVRENKGGKLTHEQQDALKKMAIRKVTDQIPEALDIAGSVMASVKDLIDSKIESAVLGLK